MTDEPMPEYLKEGLMRVARVAGNREIGGFIVGDWFMVQLDNYASGVGQYSVSDHDLLKFYSEFPNPIGFFHSHPRGRKDPSNIDIEYAPVGMRYWIVTHQGVYEWDMSNGKPTLVG